MESGGKEKGREVRRRRLKTIFDLKWVFQVMYLYYLLGYRLMCKVEEQSRKEVDYWQTFENLTS